jgi:hypothetical protein
MKQEFCGLVKREIGQARASDCGPLSPAQDGSACSFGYVSCNLAAPPEVFIKDTIALAGSGAGRKLLQHSLPDCVCPESMKTETCFHEESLMYNRRPDS